MFHVYNCDSFHFLLCLKYDASSHDLFTEMLNLEWTARDHARSVFRENGQLRAELDKKIKEVELQNKEYKKLQEQNNVSESMINDQKLKVNHVVMLLELGLQK